MVVSESTEDVGESFCSLRGGARSERGARVREVGVGEGVKGEKGRLEEEGDANGVLGAKVERGCRGGGM